MQRAESWINLAKDQIQIESLSYFCFNRLLIKENLRKNLLIPTGIEKCSEQVEVRGTEFDSLDTFGMWN